MVIEQLTALEELESLRADWVALWQQAPNATPFQSPSWLIPWWKHVGQGELRLVTVRDQERLIGLAPLFVDHNSERQEVLLLGTGITDYLDVLYLPECRETVLAAIIAVLEETSWDTCHFQQLRPGSPLLETHSFGKWNNEILIQEVCPVLTLPGRSHTLSVPDHMFQRANYYHRRASKLHPLSVELANDNNFPELFEKFVQLHSQRWQAKGGTSALGERRVRQFHKEAAQRMLADGLLRLYALRFGAQIVACLYCLVHRARVYYYLGGFAPEWKEFSPGTILLGHVIENAIEEQACDFDFLRGSEPYKYKWGATERFNFHRHIIRSTSPQKVGVYPC